MTNKEIEIYNKIVDYFETYDRPLSLTEKFMYANGYTDALIDNKVINFRTGCQIVNEIVKILFEEVSENEKKI